MKERRTLRTLQLSRDIRRGVWFLIAVTFVTRLLTFLLIPFMIVYLSKLGMTPTQIGWITGGGWIVGALISPFIGYLSDRWGHRRLYVIVMIIWAASFCCFWFAEHFYVYVLISLLNGVGRNCLDSLLLTRLFILSNDNKEKLANLSYISINAGAAIGPFIGTLLSKYVGGEMFLAVAAIAVFLLLIEPLFIRNMSDTHFGDTISFRETFAVLLKDKALPWYVIAGMLFSILYIQLEFGLPIALKADDLFDWYPMFMLISASVVVFFSTALHAWQQRFTSKQVAAVISLLYCIGFLCYIPGQLPLYILGIVLLTCGEVIFYPMWRTAVSELNPARQGTYLGVTNFSYIGFALGSIVGGSMFEHVGAGYTFVFFAALTVPLFFTFALGLALAGYRSGKQVEKEEWRVEN